MIGFTNKYLLPIVPPRIRDLFIPNLYYGCEANDPMVRLSVQFKSESHELGYRTLGR